MQVRLVDFRFLYRVSRKIPRQKQMGLTTNHMWRILNALFRYIYFAIGARVPLKNIVCVNGKRKEGTLELFVVVGRFTGLPSPEREFLCNYRSVQGSINSLMTYYLQYSMLSTPASHTKNSVEAGWWAAGENGPILLVTKDQYVPRKLCQLACNQLHNCKGTKQQQAARVATRLAAIISSAVLAITAIFYQRKQRCLKR